ncbi:MULTISPECIES: hypothetical protein [unclassified Pedobacter]|uniref:hypothetical protein n=1 Tax=unclassified Pedobacter TaxID=2628915 RepID=UPI00141DA7AD|nr:MULTISPECIES: hypothetical protein [unclassified Pedobacter]NII84235.1 hypothetical protein [Pedobacter sp. SG908]NMN38850.1 hypothetical protein [Pedobacter sp. SG918]
MEIQDKMSADIRHILNKKPKGIVRFGSAIMLTLIIVATLAYAFKEDIKILGIFNYFSYTK